MNRRPHVTGLLFLQWLSFAGVVVGGLFILMRSGALFWVWDRDPSSISVFVLLLLLAGLGRGAWVVLHLDRQASGTGGAVRAFRSSHGDDAAIQILSERIRGVQELGWFMAGLATKLGLLGTVVGFILMMGAITQVENFDFSAAQELIRRMTQGIGVALTTTLVGLVTSVVLGVQSYFIERFGETLIADLVEGEQSTKKAGV